MLPFKLRNPTMKMLRRLYATSISPDSLYEPIFIAEKKLIPTYDCIDIRLYGHDFQILERFQSYASGIIRSLKIDDVSGFAVPCSKTKATLYKAKTTLPVESFVLSEFQRVLQLVDVPTPTVTLLASLLGSHVPKGVRLTIKQHNSDDDDVRFVPDYESADLKKKLQETEKTVKHMKTVVK